MAAIRSNLFIFPVLFVILAAGCKTGPGDKNRGQAIPVSGEVADISFSDYEHDFGKVKEGEKVAYVFSFVNNGPGNLVITAASTSCGCTVPKYNRDPIAPGKGGSLEVVFDTSGRSGIQAKTISVHSNSKTPVVVLKITAEVISRQ